MTNIDKHPAGSFCWVELATSDQAAAKKFYGTLFGWAPNDMPMGPGEVYTIFRLEGRDAAAGYTLRPEQKAQHVPPNWMLYILVENVDASAAKVSQLGGKVIVAPFDVMDAGRMAVLQDPTGAVFLIWQPKQHIGAKILFEPGALCWSELTTKDPKKAEAFYTALFGWVAKHSAPGAPMEYTEFSIGGQPSIGMMAMPPGMPPHVPSYWMPYFQVTDCDGSTEKAKGLGAGPMVGPQDIPNTGRFAILKDPQGAMFAIFTPAARA